MFDFVRAVFLDVRLERSVPLYTLLPHEATVNRTAFLLHPRRWSVHHICPHEYMTTDNRNAEMQAKSFRNKARRGGASRERRGGIRNPHRPTERTPSIGQERDAGACSSSSLHQPSPACTGVQLCPRRRASVTREACPRQGAEVTRQHVMCSFVHHRAPASSEEIKFVLTHYPAFLS